MLLFFAIPKNACEEFKKLFQRIEGCKDWAISYNFPRHQFYPHLKETTLPHQPGINGLTYLYHFSLEEANAIINHPSWTKAILLRDPLERFLSAYVERIVRHPRKRGWTFADVVAKVEGGNHNVHWNPQYRLIECRKWLPTMDFVGSCSNLLVDTKAMLQKIGAWHPYGSTLWGPHKNSKIFDRDTINIVHATNANGKLGWEYIIVMLILRGE